MKTSKLQPPISRIFLFMLTLMLWNCSSSADLILPVNEDAPFSLKSGKISVEEYVCNPQSAPLLTKKKQTIGIVDLSTTTNGNLLVSVSINEGFAMKSLQIYAGAINNIPIDQYGNPILEDFNFKTTFSTYETVYNSEIIQNGFSQNRKGLVYCAVAVHAEIVETNTDDILTKDVWISGSKISKKGSWATYYAYEVIPCGGAQ